MKYLYKYILILVLIILLVVLFFINYRIIDWKIVNKEEYKILSAINNINNESAYGINTDNKIFLAENLLKIKNNEETKLILANAYLDKATLDFREEEYGNKALELLNQIIVTDPTIDEYLAVGYAYEVLQDYEKALENYNKAIQLAPSYYLSYAKRGHAYDLSGDRKLAESDYMKAYDLDNKNDFNLMNLARLSYREGRYDEAVKYSEEVISLSKIPYIKSNAYQILGLINLNNLKYIEAIEMFSKSISSYPKNGESYTNRAYAKILHSNNVIDIEAQKIIEEDLIMAIQIYENDSYAYGIYAILMEVLGNKDRSMDYIIKAKTSLPKDITLGKIEKEEFNNALTEVAERLGLQSVPKN